MPVIQELWDPVVAAETRARLPARRTGKKIDKEFYLQDVEGAYHAIGGGARLAYEANQDPKWFFNRFGDRLLPTEKQEVDVSVHIYPAIPRTGLDELTTDTVLSRPVGAVIEGEYSHAENSGQESSPPPLAETGS